MNSWEEEIIAPADQQVLANFFFGYDNVGKPLITLAGGETVHCITENIFVAVLKRLLVQFDAREYPHQQHNTTPYCDTNYVSVANTYKHKLAKVEERCKYFEQCTVVGFNEMKDLKRQISNLTLEYQKNLTGLTTKYEQHYAEHRYTVNNTLKLLEELKNKDIVIQQLKESCCALKHCLILKFIEHKHKK
jgi:hypothetical protein